jgi:hypothetical protein
MRRSLNALPWYEALALWKASALCEAIYCRYLKGEFPADDSWCASLAAGVPPCSKRRRKRRRRRESKRDMVVRATHPA